MNGITKMLSQTNEVLEGMAFSDNELMQLLRPTVVIPCGKFRKFYPRVLAAGSIVALVHRVELSRVDWAGEILVEFIDEAGRPILGHIDMSTPTRLAPRRAEQASIGWSGASGERLALVDILREAIALDRKSTVAYVKTHSHAGNLALYAGVVRERGGKVKPDDPSLTARLLRVTLTREARTMARKQAETEIEEQDDEMEEQDEEQDDAPKAKKGKKGAAKKAAGKKAAKESNGEGRTPQGVSLGNALVPLLREAGVKGAALQSAKALQGGGTLKKPALIALRDAVNEVAGTARAGENGSLASKLSSANRVVRRLSRV